MSRPDLGYLFVVTYGRSGSTLLSGVLNAIPGYLVRGENGGALGHLYAFHRDLVAEKERRTGTRTPTHPFYGVADVPVPRLLARTRRLLLDTVLRPRDDTRVVGFKEIRWDRDDLADYVAWLGEVFPGARFLVNTRDHDGVLASKWWAHGDRDDNAARLALTERRFLDLLGTLGERGYRVHYDDYVADPAVLRGLFDWLGEPWDEDAVRAVLATRHSF